MLPLTVVTLIPSPLVKVSVGSTDALGAYGEVSFVGSGDDDIDRGYGLSRSGSIPSI